MTKTKVIPFFLFSNAVSVALVFIFALSLTIPEKAISQTILVGQQAPDNQNMNRPKQGMSKKLVKALFGIPVSKKPAVGKPPISRWFYKYFTVYFEGNYVIHTVLDRETTPITKSATGNP